MEYLHGLYTWIIYKAYYLHGLLLLFLSMVLKIDNIRRYCNNTMWIACVSLAVDLLIGELFNFLFDLITIA